MADSEQKLNLTNIKEELTDFMKNNPWTALAIAAGLGFLLGKLLTGRKE
jgi:ElaB/YqjD/DUF883 family membrane-anchored ribosome-binding protein